MLCFEERQHPPHSTPPAAIPSASSSTMVYGGRDDVAISPWLSIQQSLAVIPLAIISAAALPIVKGRVSKPSSHQQQSVYTNIIIRRESDGFAVYTQRSTSKRPHYGLRLPQLLTFEQVSSTRCGLPPTRQTSEPTRKWLVPSLGTAYLVGR